jgi:hypothetical protein
VSLALSQLLKALGVGVRSLLEKSLLDCSRLLMK